MENAILPFPLETRIVKINGEDHSFNFLIVDRPDKWLAASSFKSFHKVRMAGTNRAMAIPVSGVSYSDWFKIEADYPLPDSGVENSPEREAIKNKRKVLVFELSTGIKIPGETIDHKVESLQSTGTGEGEAIYTKILEVGSAIDKGNDLEVYEQAMSSEESVQLTDIVKFDDWLVASQVGSTFRLQRPFDNFIIEFNLKQFSEKDKKVIDEETKEPMPPSKPGKNPATGRIDPSYTEYAWTDKNWLKKSQALQKRRSLMRINALLPFEVPGESIEDKLRWIGDRLLGDVVKFDRFIRDEVINYQSKLTFSSSD